MENVQKVVIQVTSDTKGVDDTIDKLQELGKIDEKNASQFKRNSRSFIGLKFSEADAVDKLNKKQQETSNISQQLNRGFQGLQNKIVAAFAISQVAAFGKELLRIGGEQEKINVAFETFLGSQEKSKALLKELADFAQKTPFNLTGVQRGAQQLLAFGFSAEEVTKQMTVLGNIAAGTGTNFEELVQVYGTFRVQNKIMTQDLRQLTARGIPILQALAKQFGITEDAVFDFASEGKIEFADLERALSDMGGEGGRFGGLMDKMSKTTAGSISNLEDSFDQLKIQIYEGLAPAIQYLTGVFTDLTDFLRNGTNPAVQEFSDELGNVTRIIGQDTKVIEQAAGGMTLSLAGKFDAMAAAMKQTIQTFRKDVNTMAAEAMFLGGFFNADQILNEQESMFSPKFKDAFMKKWRDLQKPLTKEQLKEMEKRKKDAEKLATEMNEFFKKKGDEAEKDTEELNKNAEKLMKEQTEAQKRQREEQAKNRKDWAAKELEDAKKKNEELQSEEEKHQARMRALGEMTYQSISAATSDLVQVLTNTEATIEEKQKEFLRSLLMNLVEYLHKLVQARVAQLTIDGVTNIVGGNIVQGIAQLAAVGGIEAIFAGAKAQIMQFAEGTDYVPLNGNRKGIDTVPALLTEGEAVITREMNAKYRGLSKAINQDKVIDWVMNYPTVKESLKDLQNKSFAQNVAQSLLMNELFDDHNIVRALGRNRTQEIQNTEQIVRALRSIKRTARD